MPAAAAAASARVLPNGVSVEDVMSISMSGDPFGPSFRQEVPLLGDHPTLGFVFRHDPDRCRLQLVDCCKGTPAHRLHHWRSRLRHAYLLDIDGSSIVAEADAIGAISAARARSLQSCVFCFTFDSIRNTLSDDGLPQLYFDQLRDVRRVVDSLRPTACSAVSELPGTSPKPSPPKLTRRFLKTQPDWDEWRKAEWTQHDQYDAQGMYGTPCSPPPGAAIFNWVWVYKVKEHEGNRKKARAVCDGSTRGGQVRILGHTYAATPDLTDFRMFVALCALEGKTIFGADVSNAFAEAPASAQRYYMKVDDQFRDWWAARGRPVIPHGHVIPVLKNLQGHPEAPRQWHLHIHRILQQHGFRPTTHAPCLYRARHDDEDILFLRQVDDFAVGATERRVYDLVCDELDRCLLEPMKRQDVLQHYNGIDIIQGRDHVTIHCESYITKVLDGHGWTDMARRPVSRQRPPMDSENAYIKSLDNADVPSTDADRAALTREHGFSFRQVIGELIWAMITCRIDINFPVVKLSQFASNPASIHFQAVKRVLRYLATTAAYGLTYWRLQPLDSLPSYPDPIPLSRDDDASFHDLGPFRHLMSQFALYGYVDSDWAMDIRHRRSVSGIVYMMGGAAVAWKTRVQPTVSLSTSEAEFLAASDAGRMALYLRSVLHELDVPQDYATVIFEDNRGARLMAHAGQPTRQSRHIDIRHYAILDWVERDLVSLEEIPSGLNVSDALTKQNGLVLFHRHVDVLMGRRPPYFRSVASP